MKEDLSLEYLEKIIKENNKKEEIKALKFWGLSIGLIFTLFLIFCLLLHHKEFLFILFIVALFTFGISIYSYVDKSFRLGTMFLLYTFMFITIPIAVVIIYDNVSILSVNSHTDVQKKYYSLCITDNYERNNGCAVPLERGKYIENNTTDTLVIYSVTYSTNLYPSFGKTHYPIVQTIAPQSFEVLLKAPDYLFQSPPQSIFVKKKRSEIVDDQTKYVLEYKRKL